MIAIETRFTDWVDGKGRPRRTFAGWSLIGRDIGIIGKPGQQVKLEGTSGVNPAYLVKHDPERRLLYVKHDGYTAYISRGTGNVYEPAKFVIYEYVLRAAGNEQHPYVGLFGIADLPLKWTPKYVGEAE